MVPIPKRNMYIPDSSKEFAVRDAPKPTYTKPQGSRPFKNPIIKNAPGLSALITPDRELFAKWNTLLRKEKFEGIFIFSSDAAEATTIIVPITIEISCWNPKNLNVSPISPATNPKQAYAIALLTK